MISIAKKVTKLSHKCFRKLLKKFRRKRKRQLLAKQHAEEEIKARKIRESVPGYLEQEAEKERNAKLWEEFEERERERHHRLWLLKEAEAQDEFRRKKLQLEKERLKIEEERKKFLAEIEEKQLLENATAEKNKKEKQKKEEALQETLSSLPDGNEPWHNPIAPKDYTVASQECTFYAKTGCCRFGDWCSRGHPRPLTSCTLLIKGMYSHFSMGQAERDDYDTDMALEYEDSETYQDFKNFYDDVLPEFKKFGKVVQFKVCCNHEPHLRGNVYVQYSREREAVEACKIFNGRYYAGKQLTCEFSNVTNWKTAVCGLYYRKQCPKGNNCNFLHVFRNPSNEFWATDRDYSSERKDRSYVSRASRSRRRMYANISHHYSHGERREKHHHSSSHHSDSHKRKYCSSESDESDEYSSASRSHRSSHKQRSQTPHRDSHKKKSRHRSRSRSSSSREQYEDYDRNHKKKKDFTFSGIDSSLVLY